MTLPLPLSIPSPIACVLVKDCGLETLMELIKSEISSGFTLWLNLLNVEFRFILADDDQLAVTWCLVDALSGWLTWAAKRRNDDTPDDLNEGAMCGSYADDSVLEARSRFSRRWAGEELVEETGWKDS